MNVRKVSENLVLPFDEVKRLPSSNIVTDNLHLIVQVDDNVKLL
jgi:hypothetical protein